MKQPVLGYLNPHERVAMCLYAVYNSVIRHDNLLLSVFKCLVMFVWWHSTG